MQQPIIIVFISKQHGVEICMAKNWSKRGGEIDKRPMLECLGESPCMSGVANQLLTVGLTEFARG